MEMDLKDREWAEFEIGKEFLTKNSKAYHKSEVNEVQEGGISYVSRTNANNGVESIVRNDNFKTNKKDTIVFGAENATFFYQPNKYITGNKMYYIEKDKLNKYSGLFIQLMLNKSIVNCGFGYGKGLIGSRVEKRYVLLPVNSKGEPDYVFMERYMQYQEKNKLQDYINYIEKYIIEFDNNKLLSFSEKKWKEFGIEEIAEIVSGKDIYEAERVKGDVPYITATASNNGIGYFVGNNNETLESNCLSVNRNGSVGYSFYHNYPALFSNDCRKLRLKNNSKYVGVFIAQQISSQRAKYGYGYKMGTARLKQQKIMLPVNSKLQPDYDFMEAYMRQLECQKIKAYLKYINKNKEV